MNNLSIIIPTYNEEGSIEKLIQQIHAALSSRDFIYEIIIVDDHSTDRTRALVASISDKYPVRLFLKKGRRGKAFSLYQGFNEARYDVLCMIDADLQYPPEVIPQMMKKLDKAEIVVANRKVDKTNFLRKFISFSFRTVFGRLIFGLGTDIQSGLKIFKKEVWTDISYIPQAGWAFDLEFLYKAKALGFTIASFDITFTGRERGESKVEIAKAIWEIGTNALKTRFKPVPPHHFTRENGSSIGAGIRYKKKKYVTHTALPHSLSALITFHRSQRIFLALILLLILGGILIDLLDTLLIIIAVLSFIYFVDVLFNLYLVWKSLNYSQEITFTSEEFAVIDEKELPVYSVLCPLYKEAHVIPQFIEAIAKIDWPKNKLDVMLLFEEDDTLALDYVACLNLPGYIRTVVVPDSQPKTKPKACNYGLAHAKGEYLVIYDAEDIPDPLQLKKAFLAFQKVGKDVICLQAKLNYYNPQHNLLTKLFTAEYSLWFDISLTGLQSLNTSIPLGGTSNHFKVHTLKKLQGWDSFNVTEDADLGIRLFRNGYKTAIIDSTTLEEANSKVRNWIRQRSRWIKGYMQTYLVHTRDFPDKKVGWIHSLYFNLTIGGKIAFILINPLLWLATISYFTLYNRVGLTIEYLYPSFVFYMAGFSLVFGNFLFIYYFMIGAIKKQQWGLIKYIFLVPFYWILISIAGYIALFQLIFKPHYWEKTVHGFHLKNAPSTSRESWLPLRYSGSTELAVEVLPPPRRTIAGASLKLASERYGADYKSAPAKGHAIAAAIPYKTGLLRSFFARNDNIKEKVSTLITSKKYYLSGSTFVFSILSGLSAMSFLSLDVILAKHFLSASDAGQYALVSLVGKIVYFLPTLFAIFIVPLASRNEGAKKDTSYILSRSLVVCGVLATISFVAIGMFGHITAPLLFGEKTRSITQYLAPFTFAAACFSVSSVFVSYYLVKKIYSFSVVTFFLALAQIMLINTLHSSVDQIVTVMLYIGYANFVIAIILHLFQGIVKVVENNIKDLFGIFAYSTGYFEPERKLRILIYNWRDTKHRWAGGAEAYIQEIAKRWAATGNSVTIFCGNDGHSPRYQIINGVQIVRRGGFYTVYLWAFLYYALRFRGKYDIVVDCENGIPFLTPLYVRKPVLLLIHHIHQEVFRQHLPLALSMIASVIEGRIMPLLYKNNTIITVSESSRKEIEKLGFSKPDEIHVVHPGIENDIFSKTEKSDMPTAIYLGRIKPYKNIDILIKAFRTVASLKPKARLLIAGEGESRHTITKLVDSLGLNYHVIFLGKVSDKEKITLLGSSWVAVQPSQVEGWGITVIEANACGTPVIASYVNGLKDSIVDGKTGILVKPGNADNLAEAILSVMTYPKLRNNLSQEAYIWSQNFSWDKSAKEFYEILVSTHNSRGDYKLSGGFAWSRRLRI